MKPKPTNQGKQPKGSLLPTFESKGVKWTCVAGGENPNLFVFKSDDGREIVRKWEELKNVKIR